MTQDEAQLWQLLRARPAGHRFRRQHPFGPYILDFFYVQASLAIEIDGASHDLPDQADHDARRTVWLASQGIDVLRLPASDVRFRPQQALATILARCPPPQGEVPQRGGGGVARTATTQDIHP